MFELIFVNIRTGQVKWAVQTRVIIYITLSEVSYITLEGRATSCAFPRAERLEVNRVESIGTTITTESQSS